MMKLVIRSSHNTEERIEFHRSTTGHVLIEIVKENKAETIRQNITIDPEELYKAAEFLK
jgi:hypothetical protein